MAAKPSHRLGWEIITNARNTRFYKDSAPFLGRSRSQGARRILAADLVFVWGRGGNTGFFQFSFFHSNAINSSAPRGERTRALFQLDFLSPGH